MTTDPNDIGVPGFLFGIPTSPLKAKGIIFPIPWEITVTYHRGTSLLPDSIIEATRQIEFQSLIFPEISLWKEGVAMVPACADIVGWNAQYKKLGNQLYQDNPHDQNLIKQLDQITMKMIDTAENLIKEWTTKEKWVGVLGGEHTVMLPNWKVAYESHGGDLSLIVIDAHLDLRDTYAGLKWSHATVFRRIVEDLGTPKQIIYVGTRAVAPYEWEFVNNNPDLIKVFPAIEINSQTLSVMQILNQLKTDTVYISVDVDGFDCSITPHTGTPVPGGITYSFFQELLRQIVASKLKIAGFDICEGVPGVPDTDVIAWLIFDLCCATILSRK